MKMSIKYFFLLNFVLLASSCTKVVDLEHLRPESKLVLNSVASQGEQLKASLSRTWFYTDENPNVVIKDAQVDLYVNDRLVETMSWDVEETEYYSIGNYVSSYHPVSGDKIRIEASKDGFKDVVAEAIVPDRPSLLSFSAEKIKAHDPYASKDTKNRFKVTFKDDPDAVNCYMINFQIARPIPEYDDEEWWTKPPVYNGEYRWERAYIDYASEPLFGNKISILDKVMGNDWLSGYNGRPFSDEQINGKEYTMTLEESSYAYYYGDSSDLPDSARVYLYAISEPYYRYLSALISLYEGSLNNDLADVGLAEPVRAFNNIKGGVGILGAVCVDSLTVAIQKLN